MSYCLNPTCPKPVNHPKARKCRACGSKLLLRDRYHLVKGLGKGGFGATFLASDLSLPGKPLCVIKQLRPNTDNPNFLNMARELFEREAKTLGIVGNHPQIPRLLDYFEDRNQFYLIQEFVKGNNLQQEVKKNGVLNETQVRQVLKEVLEILKAIHAQKVIHRDIKPANIIRREIDNRLVLIDFGVVKNQVNTVAAGGDPTALTAFAVGTPGFAPPEQLAMRPVYSSDVYALGVTCMYLMTGKAPKNLDCDPITGEIDWFKNITISDSFAEILTNMLEVSVKNRYKTADEVLQALDIENHIDSLSESIISSAKIEEPRSSVFSRNAVPSRRNTISTSRSSTSTSRVGGGSRFGRNLAASRLSANGKRTNNNVRNFANNAKPKPVKVDAESIIEAHANGRRDFSLKDIGKQDLQKAELSESKFHNLLAIRTNFQGADLSYCDFSDADLRQALLRGAKLNRTFFKKVNLEGADLRGADLSEASFDRCKLGGVNLSGANLTNAKISKEELDAAKTNWFTIMPNGRRGFW